MALAPASSVILKALDDDELNRVLAEAEENCRVRLAQLAAIVFAQAQT